MCSVRGCHNDWAKRKEQLNQECHKHKVKRSECCGALFNFHSPPKDEDHRMLWLKALNLKCELKQPFVCSNHFVDGRPTEKHPNPEKYLGHNVPDEQPRRIELRVFRKRPGDMDASVDDESEQENVQKRCHAKKHWVDFCLSDHTYYKEVNMEECEPALYTTLLRNNSVLYQVYTGLSYATFTCVAEYLTNGYNNTFKLHPWDQLLITLIKLRLNLLEEDFGPWFDVSKPVLSEIIVCWLDLMEKKLRHCIPWLCKETVQTTMPQCFKELYPFVTCVIDYSNTPLTKPRSLGPRRELRSLFFDQDYIKYLVAFAPSGLIMYISPAYGGSCSDTFITTNSGFLEYLHPRDEVMVDRGFNIKDLLEERKVKLIVPPPFTDTDLQLSEEDSAKPVAIVHDYLERVRGRMKDFKIISQPISINYTPKIDKILRIVAALCNLCGYTISEQE